MRKALLVFLSALAVASVAQTTDPQPEAPSLTIYNQQFAVVRQFVPLDLKAGVNHVRYNEITAHVEPDSVLLRDPNGHPLVVLEQNYRNDPISEALLLSLFEGKTIDFMTPGKDGQQIAVPGKIVRSGYVPHYNAYREYGQQYQYGQQQYASGGAGQPIIEVNGKLQFYLPGQPVFPSLSDDTILKPTLDWQLQAERDEQINAELSYVSGGMSWHADYNVVAPETGDVVDLVGWVTLDNQSGKSFENAKIKLMAGDVSKIQQNTRRDRLQVFATLAAPAAPQVTEKIFDEYHLYTLERPSTLLDRETKQVEFLRASAVHANRIYVYDGARFDQQYANSGMEYIRENASYGIQSNPKVWVLLEFKNSKENNLGMPLPAGRIRLYRRDQDGQLEFTGEDKIDHTPSDETLRIYTGNAFDVVGERRRTYFKASSSEHWVDESFEIKLRNHKTTPIEVRAVEHLYRWTNWEISQKSADFQKTDAQTVEFHVQIPPNGEKTITYMVHYSW